MSRYGDDQCEECGGVRAAGAVLCVNCLVRTITRLENKVAEKEGVIKLIVKENKDVRRQLNDALAYGFKKNQENAKLHQHIKGLQLKT